MAILKCVRGGELALPDVHAVHAVRLELVTPREHLPLQAAAGGVLPLSLGGESGFCPLAERGCVVPRNVNDGMVAAPFDRRLRPLGWRQLAPSTRRHHGALATP